VRQFHVYILASKSRVLYVGVTNALARRVYQHITRAGRFTSRYKINRLVYCEELAHPMQAIRREKAIKRMTRREKIEMIERVNPAWDDLADGWFQKP
jgi:putative endonuclease